jgi:hypothetical protein
VYVFDGLYLLCHTDPPEVPRVREKTEFAARQYCS